MPRWGRPPAGRRGKDRKDWERQQQQEWEERRFQELDSEDDDDGHGVHLTGNELHFAGTDLSQYTRHRRGHVYSNDSELDYDDNDDDAELQRPGSNGHMQLALLEKEEILVQRAMERIRRAQALGKTNVKLTEPERDALERKLAKDRAQAQKSAVASKKSDPRRTSSKSNLVAQKNKKKSSRSSLPRDAEDAPNPPGLVVAGPDGRPIYAPFGYLPDAPNSRPSSRSSSSQNLQGSPQHRTTPRRYVSGPEPSSSRSTPGRPMPDDPNWRPRSSSSAKQYGYPLDAYGHPYYPNPPLPPQYAGSPYPSLRHAASGYGSASDPVLARGSRRSQGELSETSSEDSSGSAAGVEVNVVPYGSGYEIVPAAPAPASRPAAQPKRAPAAATRRKTRR